MVQDLIADVLTWVATSPLEVFGVLIVLALIFSPKPQKKTSRDAFPEGVNGEGF